MANCPSCGADWNAALRRPFANISCMVCRREKQRRLDFVMEKLQRDAELRGKSFKEEKLGMTPEERDTLVQPLLW